MYCRACGTEIGKSDQFCRKCGQALANTAAAAPPVPTGPAAKPKKSFTKSLFLAFLVFMVLGAIIDSFKGGSGTNASNQPSAVPKATPDKLSPAQHVAELKKLVAKHPLDTADADAIHIQIKQLQLKKADSEKSTAALIKKAEDRVRWVKVRGDVSIDAVVACKAATTSMLKAPDSVEWKDHQEGYDPNKDWIYNVDLQANAMNSFGAKLRSTFYCSAICTDKEGLNGIRCIAMKVREGE